MSNHAPEHLKKVSFEDHLIVLSKFAFTKASSHYDVVTFMEKAPLSEDTVAFVQELLEEQKFDLLANCISAVKLRSAKEVLTRLLKAEAPDKSFTTLMTFLRKHSSAFPFHAQFFYELAAFEDRPRGLLQKAQRDDLKKKLQTAMKKALDLVQAELDQKLAPVLKAFARFGAGALRRRGSRRTKTRPRSTRRSRQRSSCR